MLAAAGWGAPPMLTVPGRAVPPAMLVVGPVGRTVLPTRLVVVAFGVTLLTPAGVAPTPVRGAVPTAGLPGATAALPGATVG
jgi:hypothetical protein